MRSFLRVLMTWAIETGWPKDATNILLVKKETVCGDQRGTFKSHSADYILEEGKRVSVASSPHDVEGQSRDQTSIDGGSTRLRHPLAWCYDASTRGRPGCAALPAPLWRRSALGPSNELSPGSPAGDRPRERAP